VHESLARYFGESASEVSVTRLPDWHAAIEEFRDLVNPETGWRSACSPSTYGGWQSSHAASTSALGTISSSAAIVGCSSYTWASRTRGPSS
jgi:hypothetical protein